LNAYKVLAMLIGVPKEIKPQEFRVGLTPQSVRELVALGHQLIVEKEAGAGIGATDADYRAAGADVVAKPEDVFGTAELIIKVKEPQAKERSMLRAGQALFTYLHLAPDPQQTERWTGIPTTKMLEGEREKLLKMEDEIGRRVIGQRVAVTAVSNAVRRARAGLQGGYRPLGSFLFLGQTGVGKTELTKGLAE
jgi:alanine dehydrogenase